MGQTKSSVFQRGINRTEVRQSPCIGSTSHNVAAKNAKHATHMCIDTVLRQEYSQYGVYHTAFAFRDRVSCSFCGIVACKFGDFYGYHIAKIHFSCFDHSALSHLRITKSLYVLTIAMLGVYPALNVLPEHGGHFAVYRCCGVCV